MSQVIFGGVWILNKVIEIHTVSYEILVLSKYSQEDWWPLDLQGDVKTPQEFRKAILTRVS